MDNKTETTKFRRYVYRSEFNEFLSKTPHTYTDDGFSYLIGQGYIFYDLEGNEIAYAFVGDGNDRFHIYCTENEETLSNVTSLINFL